jgi:hypothetical protein
MERLELVHKDLCGLVTPTTPGGGRYFLLLIDDHSRYMWVLVLGGKGEMRTPLGARQLRRRSASASYAPTMSENS